MHDKLIAMVATKNGWRGDTSPELFVPLRVVRGWLERPKGDRLRNKAEILISAMDIGGDSAKVFLNKNGALTANEVIRLDHEKKRLRNQKKTKEPGRGGQGEPPPGPGGGEGEGEDGDGKMDAKRAVQRATDKARENSNSQFMQVNGLEVTGNRYDLGDIPQQLKNKMNEIVQRMQGGFDMEITPLWDSNALAKRIVSHQLLDPARQHIEGRPKLTLVCDTSPSCSDISNTITRIAVATSHSGDVTSEIFVHPAPNGYWEPNSSERVGKNGAPTDEWHWKNGVRFPIAQMIAEYQNTPFPKALAPADYKNALFAAAGWHNEGTWAKGFDHNYPSNNVMKRWNAKPGNNDYGNSELTVDIVLHNQPDYVIVLGDSDVERLITNLVYHAPSHTKIIFITYQTMRNVYKGQPRGKHVWETLLANGESDMRFSTYGSGKICYEHRYRKEDLPVTHTVPTAINIALNPAYRGDNLWCDPHNFFAPYTLKAWADMENGTNLYIIPNADTAYGVVEAMALVAQPDKMHLAVQAGKGVLSQYKEQGKLAR